MNTIHQRLCRVLFVCVTILAAPGVAVAEKGDCGQPVTTGAGPKTSDALCCLRKSVGQPTDCGDLCTLDVNCSGTITVGDCLLILKRAVGQDVTLNCCPSCDPDFGFPCTSARVESREGSDLDSGWTGIAHNSDLILGAAINARILRRCSDNQAACEKDSECGNNDCVATCDCGSDPSCEVTGPTHGRNCLTTLKDCTTNADCATGVACIHTFGPPLPLSSGGTPVCVVSVFDSPLTGTANSDTGTGQTATSLKSRVFLGITVDKPCPRCGDPEQNPEVGDTFACSGGQFNGAACTVDGVSPVFGGTSFDCPPDLNASVSGTGLAIRFRELTTGTSTKTAQLPCANLSFRGNPLSPGSNPKCIDKTASGDPVCTSNADCRRCTGDSTIACTSNAQCTGNGTCAEAPDQPVSCGHWCHCGFCDGNASLPCFETADCPSGQVCEIGPGSGSVQNAPQQKPNDCSQDKFICGQNEPELCANTPVGECSEQPYRSCQAGSTTCEDNFAGECVVTSKPCFESRITRTGVPSPLGKYCAFELKTCNTNSDCPDAGDFCAEDSSRPEGVALFCVPATTSSSINNVGGITGPGAVRFRGFIQVCRCGDEILGCDEECEDGNTVNGDGCDDLCQSE